MMHGHLNVKFWDPSHAQRLENWIFRTDILDINFPDDEDRDGSQNFSLFAACNHMTQ